jgi:hypothetical protein
MTNVIEIEAISVTILGVFDAKPDKAIVIGGYHEPLQIQHDISSPVAHSFRATRQPSANARDCGCDG